MIAGRRARAVVLATALSLFFGSGVYAQEGWKFGIGTGISSFSLKGDLGFATPGGGFLADVDLSNSDTADLVDSTVGVGGFAAKGKLRIVYLLRRVTLEDQDAGLKAEWDKDQADVAATFAFARTGRHVWGALLGARYIGHGWTFTSGGNRVKIDESWTDGLIGITHAFPFAEKWSWNNRLDAGFGGSESATTFITTLNRRVGRHWVVNLNLMFSSIEFGDRADLAKSDFYLYDIDETTARIGFLYLF